MRRALAVLTRHEEAGRRELAFPATENRANTLLGAVNAIAEAEAQRTSVNLSIINQSWIREMGL